MKYTPLPTDETAAKDGRRKQFISFAAGSQISLANSPVFVLYVPIFIVAKNSGANLGLKREAAIARKIALLLCTNLIFFTVPVLVGVFQSALWLGVRNNWSSHSLGEFQWSRFLVSIFPVLCLSINSLLNPFLYALRHPKVKQKLNTLFSRCWAATRDCFGTLRQNLCCHKANVDPTNNEVGETREGRIPRRPSFA